ncbi:MAG TPA: hypothetical protein VFZ54_14195 [Burkholderiales bacterium]
MKYEGVSAGLAVERPAPAVVVVRLAGWDTGEFGDAAMKEIAKAFVSGKPLQLFIDARAVKGATIDVSNDWALWLRANRSRFAHVSMLTGSPFVQLTAKFVQRFADLGEVMRLYTDASAFDAALQASSAR